ncbi:tyrosine-type recombinase/integrase [Fictibacillus terranigra]|uniref:Tyrosine-type recombinase/integrase n=1 Tax=Fictibacillus terranigra TaxID=3058424 RepID=A0ABT8E6V3_9BACL|nr:tyrosine-type recombinase/integrase [Fictibacillus sp. CENA-BCM004]MDN4073643.1 tyrosine-type recombinase/integrase [Fictibacillus sp. CENA-BCM004]
MSESEKESKRKGKRVKVNRSETSKAASISALFEQFLHIKIAEGRAERTIEKYRGNHTYFMEYLQLRKLDHDIRLVTASVIRDYIVWMLNEKVRFDGHRFKKDGEKTVGLSPTTVNTRVKTLRPFFRYLKEEGAIQTDPMASVKDVREHESDITVLTVEELRRLLNAPNQRNYDDFRDYCLINVLIDGFFRINEALSLRETDIDFESNIITVRASIAKSRKARSIPVQPRTIRLLRELIKENEDFDSEYLFLANYGERLQANHFRKQLRIYAKQAGIKKRVHPHLIRHTAATLFLENGGSVRHLQLLMGHSDLRQVIRYTHLSNKSLAEQQNQYSVLNDVIGKLNKERKILR